MARALLRGEAGPIKSDYAFEREGHAPPAAPLLGRPGRGANPSLAPVLPVRPNRRKNRGIQTRRSGFGNFSRPRLVWSAILAYYTAPTTAGSDPIWRLERWQSG